MATFIPAPDCVRCTLIFSQADASQAQMNIHVKGNAAATSATLTALAAEIVTWFGTDPGTGSPKAFMSSSYALASMYLRALDTQASPSLVTNTSLPIAGTDSTGVILPEGLTFALTLRSGLAGRSQRGRVFVPGLTDGSMSNVGENLVSATTAAHLVAAYNNLITLVAGATIAGWTSQAVVIVSYSTNKAPRITAQQTPATTFGYHDLFLDFQRRRAPGHNIHH